jgi:type II secretory pathway pseudopilin PulG
MTVAEILKASGMDDAAIAALDAKVLAGFNGVLTSAEESAKKAEEERVAAKAAQDAAELAQRANKEFYEGTIVPSLNGWETQEQTLKADLANQKALAAFYETQAKEAKASGFIAADAPGFTPTTPVVPARGEGGKFVAGGGGTPGSPTFKMEDIDNRLGNGLDNGFWAVQEYQRLSGGQFLPDSVSKLAEEASFNKLPFKDYVARKYDFSGKAAAIQAKADADMRAKIAAEAVAPYEEKLKAKDAEWQKKLEEKAKEISERGGNNPDVRRAAISQYPEIKKAVEEGTRKDPLSMTKEERQVSMRRDIQNSIAANEEAKVAA